MRESIKLIKQSIKLRKQASSSLCSLPPCQRVAQWTTSFNRMGARVGKRMAKKTQVEKVSNQTAQRQTGNGSSAAAGWAEERGAGVASWIAI